MPLSKLVHVIHFYLIFCTVPTMPPPMPFSKAVVFTNLYGEEVIPATANRQDEACADTHARGFWG